LFNVSVTNHSADLTGLVWVALTAC
jgi:hypothetical protein